MLGLYGVEELLDFFLFWFGLFGPEWSGERQGIVERNRQLPVSFAVAHAGYIPGFGIVVLFDCEWRVPSQLPSHGEIGEQLHAKCKYQSLSGTNVAHDFVEMPSQFNENFLRQREYLDGFARHYLTGESIPQDLIDKIEASAQYGAAYACMRQLSFGYLDMAWHGTEQPIDGDPYEFEYQAMKPVKVFEPVEGCIMSPQFTHLFSGGYAAGYYGYKWAEMLDADAFSKFEEEGLFNPTTAASLRDIVLSRGNTEPAMDLYKRWRGREPKIDALLRRDGIKK